MSALSFLAPTEFMIGNALGLTIGATILSFYVHSVFANLPCNETAGSDAFRAVCEEKRGALGGVWFWSGTVCFLNFVTALLIAYGRHELAPSTAMYEQVSNMTMEQYEAQIRNQSTPRQPFVGDYSSVPEIRDGTLQP